MSWINRENKSRGGDEEKKYPFAKWMSWLFLAVSMLLLIYTYYRSEITYQGANHVKYFKYYLISLAGILFWGGCITVARRDSRQYCNHYYRTDDWALYDRGRVDTVGAVAAS